MMGVLATLSLSIVMAGAADEPHAALMDEIEAATVLPPRSGPISEYGRHFAFAGPGRVRVLYVVPFPKPDPNTGCAKVSLNPVRSRDCTAEERAASLRKLEAAYAAQVKPGERRWYDDVTAMPVISDGGCAIVTIEYDVAAKQVLSSKCNPLA